MRLLIQLILILPLSVTAQNYLTSKTATGNAKAAYDAGRKYLFAGNSSKAIASFESAIKNAPNFIDAYIQLGAAQMELAQSDKAIQNFSKATELDPKYEPKVWYALGTLYAQAEKYPEAVNALEQFLKLPDIHPDLLKKGRLLLQNSRFIPTALKNPVPFNPKSLGAGVNTNVSEYLPALTADGETLIYTAMIPMGRLDQEDFYISQKKDSLWQKGVPLDALNTDDNEGAHCIAADGRMLIFTACNRPDGLGSCDIYVSVLKNGQWAKPNNMGSTVNTSYWDGQPSLSADGAALYFASDRPGGRGGKDIWVSHRNTKGYWAQPEPLDSTINTPFDDQTPFIHPDGQTLYFTSDGHPGMGANDIFMARRDSLNKWTTPRNLGYPINTNGSEAALTVSLDGRTAYFARNVATSNTPKKNYDIYAFDLPEAVRPQKVTYVRALVRHATTKEPLVARLEVVDLATNRPVYVGRTNEQGIFLVCLPFGKKYALNVSKEQFLFQSEHFNLSELRTADKPFSLELNLVPLPESVAATKPQGTTPTPTTTSIPVVGQPVILKNVFFETGLATLRSESYYELNRLKQLLDAHPTLRIEIQGHTDNVGSDAANKTLSEQRAKVVHNYLVQQGISASRLTYKGFGATQPVADNATNEGRQQNRRTAFIVL
jgi:outer membrane protein OmpA-like peptidoglycan-associated protein